ncbi:hypothetical protein Hanom_Chr15g01411651 [Helianthus anomalus]
MSVYLKKRIEEQIVEDKSCKDLLETNMSRVRENMKRREEIFNLLSGMKDSSVRVVAMMFMVDLRERDEKQLKELADAITILGCSMDTKIKFLKSFFLWVLCVIFIWVLKSCTFYVYLSVFIELKLCFNKEIFQLFLHFSCYMIS